MKSNRKTKEKQKDLSSIILDLIFNTIFSIPIFCYKREKKKKNEGGGYNVYPLPEYFLYLDKYTTYTNKYYITIYEKYGKTYYIDNEEL